MERRGWTEVFQISLTTAIALFFLGCASSQVVDTKKSLKSSLHGLDFKSTTEIQVHLKDCSMNCQDEDADLSRTILDILDVEAKSREKLSSAKKTDLKAYMQGILVYTPKMAPACARLREDFTNEANATAWLAGLCLPFIDQTEKQRFFWSLSEFRGDERKDPSFAYRLARYAMEIGKPFDEVETLTLQCIEVSKGATDCQNLLSYIKEKYWGYRCVNSSINRFISIMPISDRHKPNLKVTIMTDDRVFFGDPDAGLNAKSLSSIEIFKENKSIRMKISYFDDNKASLQKRIKRAGKDWGVSLDKELVLRGNQIKGDKTGILLNIKEPAVKVDAIAKKLCTP